MRALRLLSALPRPSDIVRHFVPSWFTVVMGTGSVGALIAQFPYDATFRNEVGWAFWWLSVAQFVAFTAMLACRFVFFPAHALEMLDQPAQAMFLGAIPPSISTIITGLLLFAAPRWGRPGVVTAAVVMWWINTGLALLCTILLPFYMFVRRQRLVQLERLTAVYLMPLTPCVVAAGNGGVVAHAASLSAADNIIHMSYILWGVAVPLLFMVMTAYYRRLMVHKLPSEERIVSSFLPVGSCGMAALALLNLGSAALRQYPPPSASKVTAALQNAANSPAMMAQLLHQASDLAVSNFACQAYTSSAAAVLLTVGNVGGLILWGAGIWWLTIAVISVARTAYCMHFVIGWRGFVFPSAVFSSAANTLWKQLPGMRALRPVAAALICCCIALWGMCSALTLFHCYNGSLLYTPCMNRLPGCKEIPSSDSQGSGSTSDRQRQEERQAGQSPAWGHAGGHELELHPYGEP